MPASEESFNNNNAQEQQEQRGMSISRPAENGDHSPPSPSSTDKERTVSFNESRSARLLTPVEGQGRFVAKNLSQVFNSLDRRETDRTVPRQQQVQIVRKNTEKPPTRQVSPAGLQATVDSFRPRAVTAPVMTTKRRKEVNLEYKRKEIERREQREIEYANARAGQDESLDEQNDRTQNNKYRFAFKKNKIKENKEDFSQPKAMPRSSRKKMEGGVSPTRELSAQSAPTEDIEIAKLRNRSASASSNSDLKKKRTRRRRGRKTTGNGQDDGQVGELTMEEAINWIRQDAPIADVYDHEAHARIEKEHGCEVKIVNGTTYFTPSTERIQYGQTQSPSNDDFRSSQWSPEDGRFPDSNSASTQFSDRYDKNIYSQSAPLQPRIVKGENSTGHDYKAFGDKLRTIWAKKDAESKKNIWDELGTDKLASESVLSVIESEPKASVKPDRSIWSSPTIESNSSPPKPIRKPNVWEPRPQEQAGSFGFNSFEREASPVDYFNSTKFHPRMDVLSLDHRDDELSFHYDQANINSNMSSVPYSPLTRISSG